MPQLRIALVQEDCRVGDIEGNRDRVLRRCAEARDRGANVVILPETFLVGYPIEDLAMRESVALASRSALQSLPQQLLDQGCGELTVVLGYLDRDRSGIRNAAAVLHGGQIVSTSCKHYLPNYGVFDEFRYFQPGNELPLLRAYGLDIGVVICEDIWQDGGPVAAYAEAGVDLLLCINASPYEQNKDDTRLDLVRRRAAEAGAAMAYVNRVGGQDELVFDGDSMLVDAHGQLLARAPLFEPTLLVADVDIAHIERAHAAATTPITTDAGLSLRGSSLAGRAAQPLPAYAPSPAPEIEPTLDDHAEIWRALVVGLRDYVVHNGFTSVTFGFSGGIDSSVCAALATDALGPEAVYGVSLPSGYSSQHSRDDAAELARRLGCHFQTRPIGELVDPLVAQLELTGLAAENVQARVRGVVLMAMSNQHGHLVLAPGNKSELAVGYSTIYGDAVGGFAPIKDVPKTLLWQLARWRNDAAAKLGRTPPIPENSIAKEPSAELRPDQKDTDSLPPYAELDAILDGYVEGDQGYAELLDNGFDPETVGRVLRMVDAAEYKRRQYPPGTKISFKAFGKDRRLPITSSWAERRIRGM